MDIAMIIPRLDSIGGGEKFFLECLLRWQKTNDVTVYTTSFQQDLIEDFGIDSNIEIIKPYFNNSGLSIMTLPFEMGKLSRRIGKHEVYNPHLFPTNLIENHPSVWVPQEPPRMLYDLKKQIMQRQDISLLKRTLFYSFSPFIKYMNTHYHSVDEIVANSNYSRKYLEEVYGTKIKNIVYPGVDWDNYTPNKGQNNAILAVNRLFPEKKVDLTIKAMQFLKDHILWIVGEGTQKPLLEKLVIDLGLEDRVKFWGNVNEKKLKELYSECFCTVYTPLREPFGIVPLESMASGKPVIGGKEGGFTEIMEEGVHGFLVDPKPQKIAEKILYLSHNPEIYKKMSKQCRNDSKRYSWDNTALNLWGVLNKF